MADLGEYGGSPTATHTLEACHLSPYLSPASIAQPADAGEIFRRYLGVCAPLVQRLSPLLLQRIVLGTRPRGGRVPLLPASLPGWSLPATAEFAGVETRTSSRRCWVLGVLGDGGVPKKVLATCISGLAGLMKLGV